MTTSRTPLLRKKWPLLALVLAAILALILVIWQLQTSPETNDAYVYADTIDVVPEVSGRIVEMPIRDNQRVKKGDLLFRIDPRPYQAMLDDAKARLTTLDAQIMLTQRTIKAQEYNAQSVAAAVERARALVKQTTSTRIRLEPLVPQGFASQEDLDQARTAEKAARAELEATLLQAKTGLGGRDRRGCHGGATRRDPGANRPRRTASGIYRSARAVQRRGGGAENHRRSVRFGAEAGLHPAG